ncbi:hypothetical protein EC890511_3699, partial [Escherichia coli 89.0511]
APCAAGNKGITMIV